MMKTVLASLSCRRALPARTAISPGERISFRTGQSAHRPSPAVDSVTGEIVESEDKGRG
jgi:hypothetical protein